jgi:hypothetical protein
MATAAARRLTPPLAADATKRTAYWTRISPFPAREKLRSEADSAGTFLFVSTI